MILWGKMQLPVVFSLFFVDLMMPSAEGNDLDAKNEWITSRAPHVTGIRGFFGQASDHWQSGVMGRSLANTQVHRAAPRASVEDRHDLTIKSSIPKKMCKLNTEATLFFWVGNWKFRRSSAYLREHFMIFSILIL